MPSVDILATNASPFPPVVACAALKTGKLVEAVVPAMYAFPAVSTAMELAPSSPLPPRYVEYAIDPSGFNFVTKASPLHFQETSKLQLACKDSVLGNPWPAFHR